MNKTIIVTIQQHPMLSLLPGVPGLTSFICLERLHSGVAAGFMLVQSCRLNHSFIPTPRYLPTRRVERILL